MWKQRNKAGGLAATMLVAALAAFGLASSASADEYQKFQFCPSTNPEVNKCLISVTDDGATVLGKKTVPIVNPVTLQGGYSKPVGGISTFFAATNGVTLSKTPQPVPGGLAGIVPPEDSPSLIKKLTKFFFENGLTGVNATLELAGPVSAIKVNELGLIFETGVALSMPVKVHLENPFLGKNCYVGSSSSPIVLNFTTGTTSPPEPNEPISGTAGALEFLDGGRILQLNGAELVDNSWSAPTASGCGGILSFLVNPIINAQIGLPSAAGKNTAILENTISVTTAKAFNESK